MSSMEECIKREIGGREPEQVERLMLDQAKCNDGLAHLAPFANLVSLSMCDASIASLSAMPALDNLATLKLSDNKIKNGLESLTKLAALEKLYLAGNQIPDIETLDPLKKLSRLEWLDLEGNPVTRVPGYADKIFEMLPSLMVLDGKNREGEELPDADDDDEESDEDDGKDGEEGEEDSDEDSGEVGDEDGDEEAANADDAGGEEDEEDDADEDEDDGEDEDGGDEEEEDDDDGREEYTDYGAILGGDADAYDDEDDDDDFKPPDEEPRDLEIADEDDGDLEAADSVLGKHPLDDDEDEGPSKR